MIKDNTITTTLELKGDGVKEQIDGIKVLASDTGTIKVILKDIDLPIVYIHGRKVTVVDVKYHWQTNTNKRTRKYLEVTYLDGKHMGVKKTARVQNYQDMNGLA